LQTAEIQKPPRETMQTAHRVYQLWQRFGHNAVGRKIFNFLFARAVPYSGSIHANILTLEPGKVTIELKDRRKVRNHLKSIHAIALANLGELASGLSMISAIPAETRAIVVNLQIEYLKKARGRLLATGTAKPPKEVTEPTKTTVKAVIEDADGDVVATLKVDWLLSPPKEPMESS